MAVLTPEQIAAQRALYFFVTEDMFHDGGVAWGYIEVIRHLLDTVEDRDRIIENHQSKGR